MNTDRNSRVLALAAALTVFIPSAAAQSTGIIPLMFEIIGFRPQNPWEILGIVSTFAVMVTGVYYGFKEVLKAAPVFDTADLTSSGRRDGRNGLLIFSVAFTLSGVAGARTLAPDASLLQGFQGLIILSFGALLFAGLAFVAVAGPGVILGGVGLGDRVFREVTDASYREEEDLASSETVDPETDTPGSSGGSGDGGLGTGSLDGGSESSGGGGESVDTVDPEDIEGTLGAAASETQDAKSEASEGAQTGNTREIADAVKEFEHVISVIKKVERQINGDFAAVEREIQAAAEEFENVGSNKSSEIDGLEDIANRLDLIEEYTRYLVSSNEGPKLTAMGSNGPYITFESTFDGPDRLDEFIQGNAPPFGDKDPSSYRSGYGIGEKGMLGDARKINQELDRIEDAHDQDAEDVHSGFEQFDDAVINAIALFHLYGELHKILNELRGDTEKLEQLEDRGGFDQLPSALNQEIANLENEEDKAESLSQRLSQKNQAVSESVSKILNALDKDIIDPDQKELERLERVKNFEETGLRQDLEMIYNASKNVALSDADGSLDDIDLIPEEYAKAFTDSQIKMLGRGFHEIKININNVMGNLQEIYQELNDMEKFTGQEEVVVVRDVEALLGDIRRTPKENQVMERLERNMKQWIQSHKS